MAKINEDFNEVDEELFEEDFEMEIVEKKSFLAKAKDKVSAIGDMTLRDAGKKVLKVGGAVAGAAVIAFGAVKVFGNKDDIDYDVTVITDEDGNEIEVISDVEVTEE